MPTYPAYSTLADTREYVEVFLDKDTKLQQTVTKVVADISLRLVDSAILPFDVDNYAQVFDRGKKYLKKLESVITSAGVDISKYFLHALSESRSSTCLTVAICLSIYHA